jgi:cytochrome c5
MHWSIRAAAALLVLSVHVTGIEASRQARPQSPAASPEGPGKETLQRKCFQCHQIGMWSAMRQDRKAWESTLYRMVGRGALWTPEEISAMADYLAQIRGPGK